MKKGFTLIELLAVISIMALLAVAVVPNIIDNYQQSLKKIMVTEENNVTNAAKLYVEDACISVIGAGDIDCPSSYNTKTSTPEGQNIGFVCLSDIQSAGSEGEGYIDSVKYNKKECKGITIFTFKSATSRNYQTAKTYLWCGDTGSDYATEGVTADMKTKCG